MSLKTQLMDDMKTAMKARDQLKLGTIRFLLSEVKKHEIDHGELDEAGMMKLIAKQVKQMQDAVAEFKQGGRDDLVEDEEQKIKVLQAYLPEQLSDDELETAIEAALADLEDPNMGQAMQAAKAAVGDQADGRRVSEVVKKLLNQ